MPSQTAHIGCLDREACWQFPLHRKIEVLRIRRLQPVINSPGDGKVSLWRGVWVGERCWNHSSRKIAIVVERQGIPGSKARRRRSGVQTGRIGHRSRQAEFAFLIEDVDQALAKVIEVDTNSYAYRRLVVWRIR